MFHCGADVHSKSTMLRILNGKGVEVFCKDVPMERKALQDAIRPFKRRGVVVIQETGSSAAFIQDVYGEIGVKVITVPSSKMKMITQSKKKGDRRDAYQLAWHSLKGNLPEPVYIPTRQEQDLRSLISAQVRVRKGRTAIANGVRGQLEGVGAVLPGGTLSRMDGWERLLEKDLPGALRSVVELSYSIWVEQTRTLDGFEKEIKTLTTADDLVRRVVTIPDVGPACAAAVRAYLGDPARFHGVRAVVSYAGFCPSQKDSGQRIRRGGITKEGPTRLRSVFVQAAHGLIGRNFSGHPGWRRWYEGILHRTGCRNKAVVALARRLLVLCYHVAKSGGVFEPSLEVAAGAGGAPAKPAADGAKAGRAPCKPPGGGAPLKAPAKKARSAPGAGAARGANK